MNSPGWFKWLLIVVLAIIITVGIVLWNAGPAAPESQTQSSPAGEIDQRPDQERGVPGNDTLADKRIEVKTTREEENKE